MPAFILASAFRPPRPVTGVGQIVSALQLGSPSCGHTNREL